MRSSGQLGGVVLEADAAFAVLVAASQRENVKLFTIAQRIETAQDEP